MSDEYLAEAELHDLFMAEVWDSLVPRMGEVFGGLDAEATIVDIGAGSGVGTIGLARVTRARIVAVEPSLVMRAGLLARISDDAELARRVSVLAGAAPEILDEVEAPIEGFVCAHMLGHLSPGQRLATFRRLAELLSPAGVGFIPLPSDATPAVGTTTEERRIGRHRYVARHTFEGAGSPVVAEYSVLDGERVLRSRSFTSSWTMPPRSGLSDELREAGLDPDVADGRVGLVRRRKP